MTDMQRGSKDTTGGAFDKRYLHWGSVKYGYPPS